jgi:hypothetical protein
VTREQQYKAAYAKAVAAADCALGVSTNILPKGCVPAGVKDEKAYRGELGWIVDNLEQRAAKLYATAKSLRPTHRNPW